MTCFQSVIGNNPIKDRLQLLLERNALPHLLLFCGIEGIGKRLFAKKLACSYLGVSEQGYNPDLHMLHPEGKTGMHHIAAVRRAMEAIYLAPFASEHKALIIDDAERMLPAAANALLKTLEEPPKNTLIILISSLPQSLLPTILSRCQTVRFQPCTEAQIADFLVTEHKLSPELAERQARSARGSIARALEPKRETGGLEEQLFSFLIKSHKSVSDCLEMARLLQKELELQRKALEAELKEGYTVNLKEQTAAFKQAVEQEIEGALSLFSLKSITKFFQVILAYYRDLNMLAQGVRSELYFSDKEEALIQALNQGELRALEKVGKLIQQAKQAIERQTSVQNVFENLLLQLM